MSPGTKLVNSTVDNGVGCVLPIATNDMAKLPRHLSMALLSIKRICERIAILDRVAKRAGTKLKGCGSDFKSCLRMMLILETDEWKSCFFSVDVSLKTYELRWGVWRAHTLDSDYCL